MHGTRCKRATMNHPRCKRVRGWVKRKGFSDKPVIGANIYLNIFNSMGCQELVTSMVLGMPGGQTGIILMMMLVFLIMGMFMDWVGIVLLIMPVFLPIVFRLPAEELGFIGCINSRYVAIWLGSERRLETRVAPTAPVRVELSGS